MHPWVWGRMRLYGVQGTQSVRADDEPETRPNHRGGGQHSTVDHHRKASKAAHFSRKSAAPRLHRRLEKILPIEFFQDTKLNSAKPVEVQSMSAKKKPWMCEFFGMIGGAAAR